jgi:ribonuclease P/MRP protein subunit POP1
MQDDRVPIMLIQRSVSDNAIVNNTSSSGVHGWTLLVPSGWSMPFFSSLTYTGTRVAGLRERKTQFFESRQPSFPEDFPTTSANATWAAEIGREEKERWSKKPPAKRFNYEKVLGSDGIRSNPWIAHWGSLLGIGEPELIPTQPIPDGATSANVTPWLLRAPDVAEILASAAESPSSLLTLLDTLRLRKGMPALSKLGAEDLLRGTLVQVRVKMVTRGSVGDMAVIYSMDEQEESKWRAILSQGKTNDGKDGHVESEDEITVRLLRIFIISTFR